MLGVAGRSEKPYQRHHRGDEHDHHADLPLAVGGTAAPGIVSAQVRLVALLVEPRQLVIAQLNGLEPFLVIVRKVRVPPEQAQWTIIPTPSATKTIISESPYTCTLDSTSNKAATATPSRITAMPATIAIDARRRAVAFSSAV